jgi:predicted TIM-barrel fold metal-dependent hydrolase
MEGKVILEEHFSTELNNKFWDAKGEETRNGRAYAQDIERRLMDSDAYVTEMDRCGVDVCILSLTSPGVQSVVDTKQAAELAHSANDYAKLLMQKYPGRIEAFATVPMQNPAAGADVLEQAVKEFRFKGALINGYSNVGPGDNVQYLDEEPVWEFWERVSKLNVPVYLHPREPLPSQQRALKGYPELGGSAWAFGLETSTHAVRLMLSGLFDKYPNVQIILGHLGEGLPFLLPRLQHRLDAQREGLKGAKCLRRPSYYFANNFYITTSGHFHTKQLHAAMAQIGVTRVLFSTDYPYEQMDAGCRWFDDLEMENVAKAAIGRTNARNLFSLTLPDMGVSEIAGSAS